MQLRIGASKYQARGEGVNTVEMYDGAQQRWRPEIITRSVMQTRACCLSVRNCEFYEPFNMHSLFILLNAILILVTAHYSDRCDLLVCTVCWPNLPLCGNKIGAAYRRPRLIGSTELRYKLLQSANFHIYVRKPETLGPREREREKTARVRPDRI